MLLNETQAAVHEMARKFAQESLAPGAAERDRTHAFPMEQIKAMGELGLMGMLIPEEYGGSGLDYLTMAAVLEEIAAADGSASTIFSVQNSLVGAGLLQFGTEEQKKELLTPIAKGEKLGAFALTEPHAGSDAGAIRTRATKDGNDYVLNGTKQFISTGKNADYCFIFAVTDPAAGKKGITAFFAPTNTPGYTVAKVEEKLGQVSSDTATLVFEDMRVAAKYRIGQEGEGYKIALSNLEGGRIGIAAQAVGLARAALDCALPYAKERETFGKPIIEHQAVAWRLADMATDIEAARQLLWHACALRDAKIPCLKEACMAKLFASEAAERVASAAMQVLGGYSYLKDFPVERIYRDMRVCQLYEGTSDIQRLIISNKLKEA